MIVVTIVEEVEDVSIRDKLDSKILIFDGAMGTMLQERELKTGELPEVLNITSSDAIIDIHKRYIAAGANIISTNTFGANELKIKNIPYSVEELISSAVDNAKNAIGDEKVYIALDIGPIGELLEPMGTLSFEEAYNIFKRQVIAGVKAGIDLVLIETMTDLYEAKAAVLAVKENSNLPVFCTMSYEEDGRTFTGCNITSMVMVLEGLGVDVLGINCSLGPKEFESLLDEILMTSNIPIMVQPNAGLPQIVNGKTQYNISPDKFASYAVKFVEKGVRILGGCCGTTDNHIKVLADSLKDKEPVIVQSNPISGVCTPTKSVLIDGVKVIGERINPTGKEIFKKALKKGDMEYILKEAIVQVEAGAEILDINIGLPEINEEEMIIRVIKDIQSILDVPLQIDSTNPKVIEAGLRVYNGKAIVNSVNGEEKVLDEILPIVKKYGASVIGLTLDERGIAESPEERLEIAKFIIDKAEQYEISRENVFIDTLTLTAASQQKGVKETLKALTMVKEELGVKTTLGVSNVSYGLPNRALINKTFFAAALYAGLDLSIIDPLNTDMMDTVKASRVLWNQDKDSVDYLRTYENIKLDNAVKFDNANSSKDLSQIIQKGTKEEAKLATIRLLAEKKPLELVNEYIIPTLDIVGKRYESGDIFLPQLIRTAEIVKSSFEIIKEKIVAESSDDISQGKVILATVKGDIHDIGKNIVKVLLENYNYEVIDLGKDVPKETILEEAIKKDVKLIGLSALMTTTVKNMEETIHVLKEHNPDIVVMVGGAVLDENYANMIKADYYGKDAKEAIEIAKKILG